MSQRIKSTYRPKGRGFGRGYPKALIEVEEPEEEPTIESKNIPPRQERKDEGASASPGEGKGKRNASGCVCVHTCTHLTFMSHVL